VQGYFSFYEYAVSSWASHLEAGIAAANTKGLLDQLAESLEVFLDLHSSNHSNALVASKTLQDRLYPLKEFAFYTQVTQAIVSIRKELRRNGQGPSKDEPLDISMITTKVRRVLENLVSAARNPETELTLKIFYGPNLFKCPRINCQYFYKGFSNQGHRDQHVARHERAFTCFFEGCPTTTFGCTTAKDLADHMSNYHGIEDDLDFPEIPTVSKRIQNHPSTFQCDRCTKRFTRAFNLRNHMRTHNGQKPCVCGQCGVAFVRESDKVRHERGHLGEKNFVCKGPLAAGGEWGCGLSFARLDKLMAHHRSAVGARCKQPLLEEQADFNKQVDEERNGSRDGIMIAGASSLEPGQIYAMETGSFPPTPMEIDVNGSRILSDPSTFTPAAWDSVPPIWPKSSPSEIQLAGSSEHLEMVAISKPNYQRPMHYRVFCKQCDSHPEGFRSEHELRRHQEREHKGLIKKWICIEPDDGDDHPKPVLPLPRCRACREKKRYGAYYNAAAHLRRAHFKPKQKRKGEDAEEKRREKTGGDWPPMAELKYWMKEIEEVVEYEGRASNPSPSPDPPDNNDEPLFAVSDFEN
jgi:hypothetical protein